ncbi:hypothetical protein ID866_7522 [Astraeus odoratus]|nr:hypothetical protein ID866_7522 [Astraeus odoratus]
MPTDILEVMGKFMRDPVRILMKRDEKKLQSPGIRPFDNMLQSLQCVAENEIESNWDQVVDNFDNMDLQPEFLRSIYAYGFGQPSVIQQRAIVPVIKGRDMTAQAQFSTGKTVSVAISILQQLDVSIKACQALILAPNGVLAQQIPKVVWLSATTWTSSTTLASVP